MKKIQIRPQPWTHHHAHRLFHLSMGICFGFAALVMVAGMGAFWMNANADTVVDHDLLITATVGGVNPGPIDTGGSSGSRPPASTANPSITIAAEPQGQVPRIVLGAGSNTVSAYAFNTLKPSFSGTTSVSNGIIFIYVEGPRILNSTARASTNGIWSWQAPDPFPVGTYTIVATVYDSYDLTKSASTKEYFTITNPAVPVEPGAPVTPTTPGTGKPGGSGTGNDGGTTTPPVTPPVVNPNKVFGIFFEILDKYKTVQAGTKTVGWVSLVSNLERPIKDQEVKYIVTSPEGKVILESSDLVSFSKLSQFLKEFTLAPLTQPGEYTLRISSTYNGIESVSSDKFTVTAAPTAATVAPQGVAIIWSLLILLLILFLVLMIIAYRWVRHHTRQLDGADNTM